MVLFFIAANTLLHSAIQLLSCIIAHLLLSVVNSCRLYNDRQVPARTDRNRMTGHFITKELGVFLVESQTVVLFVLVPLFQFDDQINALGLTDAFNTIQSLHINNTDTAKLDEMSVLKQKDAEDLSLQ